MLYQAKALFDNLQTVEESELRFKKGDILSIIEVNESGWSLAQLGNQEGWVPSDFVEKVDASVASSAATAPAPSESNSISQQVTQAVKDLNNSVSGTPSSGHTCSSCKQGIDGPYVSALNLYFHPEHFTCKTCSVRHELLSSPFRYSIPFSQVELGGKPYLEKDGTFYCEPHFHSQFSPKCAGCGSALGSGYITAMEKDWHPQCFVCAGCKSPFPTGQFRRHEGSPYCDGCFVSMHALKCAACSQPISGEVFKAMDRNYHAECFKCSPGKPFAHVLPPGAPFHMHEDEILCPEHYKERFMTRCFGCKEAIEGQFIRVMDRPMHQNCWKCLACQDQLNSENATYLDDQFFCKSCASAGVSGAARNQPVPQVVATQTAVKPVATFVQPTSAAPATANSAPNRPISIAPAKPTTAAPTSSTSLANRLSSVSITESKAPTPATEQRRSSLSASTSFADPTVTKYPHSVLKDKDTKPADVDPSKKEQYLSDEEFQQLFGMARDAFAKLAGWRRDDLKKKVGLF